MVGRRGREGERGRRGGGERKRGRERRMERGRERETYAGIGSSALRPHPFFSVLNTSTFAYSACTASHKTKMDKNKQT